MADKEAIIKIISISLEGLKKNPNVKMYLVVGSKDSDEPYIFYKIDVEGNVPTYFLNTLQKKLYYLNEEADTNNIKFKDFFAAHRNQGDILYVDAAEVPNFKWMIDKLAQKPTKTTSFPSMKELADIWGFAVDVDTEHGKTVYFRKFTESKIIGKENEKGKWTGKLYEGRLTDLQGDVLTFDEQIDCIYFASTDSIVITSVFGRFEKMFDFRDYYKNETKRALKALQGKFLIIDNELIPKAAERIMTSQRITKLSKSGIFKEIESKKITTFFFEQTRKVVGEQITYDIYDGKVAVQDMKALDSFVDACLCRYLLAPAGYDEDADPVIFSVEYKELFEKAKKVT